MWDLIKKLAHHEAWAKKTCQDSLEQDLHETIKTLITIELGAHRAVPLTDIVPLDPYISNNQVNYQVCIDEKTEKISEFVFFPNGVLQVTFEGIENLVGKRYGKLTVTGIAQITNGKVKWNCRCDCGQFCKVYTKSLTYGNIKSCGCSKKQK
jgi:hypothetical protein